MPKLHGRLTVSQFRNKETGDLQYRILLETGERTETIISFDQLQHAMSFFYEFTHLLEEYSAYGRILKYGDLSDKQMSYLPN